MKIAVNNNWASLLTLLVVVIPWLMGIVLAKGFIQVLVSVLFAPYAWYLVVERLMHVLGWV